MTGVQTCALPIYKVIQSPDDTSLYLNIFTNAIALNVTSGFLRTILEEIDPESTIGDILPNMKAYVKVNLNPYSLAVGALAYNKTGTVPVLKLELALEGLNGDENSSSLAFGTEDEIKKLQTGSKDIFYYANFYYDSEGEFAKNYDSSDYVRLYKDASGNLYSVKEKGGYILNEDGIIVAKPAGYEGVTYAPYEGPSQRFSQAGEVMKEILPESRYAFGSKLDERYSHNSEFEGVLYTSRINKETQKTEYVPIAEVETRFDSSKYRDICDTDVFRNFTGLMFVADSNDLYIPIYKQQLVGYTGEGNLQYRLATEADKAEDSVYKNRIITAKDAEGTVREYVPVDEPLTDANGNYIKDAAGNYVFDDYTDMYEADRCGADKVYTLRRDFNGYVEALDIDLNQLITNISNIDVLSMLGGLKTLELGLHLDITLKANDIINWANRMTEFIGDPALTEYLYFMIAAIANDASSTGKISFEIGLKIYLNLQNVLGYLTDTSGSKSIVNMLKGSAVYAELTYDSSLHNAPATARLWVEVTDDKYEGKKLVEEGGKLNLYIDAEEIGRRIGWGDFFYYGAIENRDLNKILGTGATSAEAMPAASFAADNEADTGMIPENIWGILNMLIGRLLIARDFITVGLNENLLSEIFVNLSSVDSELLDSVAKFLPKLFTSNTSDTSGITLNVSGDAPTVNLNVGFKVGSVEYMSVENYNKHYGEGGDRLDEGVTGVNWSGATFSEEQLPAGYELKETDKSDSGKYVLVSTEDYALVTYVYPKWQGATFDYNNGKFTPHTGDGAGLYMKHGDFSLSAAIDGLYVRLNKKFSVDKLETMGSDSNGDGKNDLDQYVRVENLKAQLKMSISVSIYGSGKEKDNTIDLSQLLDLIMELIAPDSNISGSTLQQIGRASCRERVYVSV